MAPPSCVVVTGANTGLGFDACRQLAKDHAVPKVLLACRNEAKAVAAIEKLMELTGKPKDTFGFISFDASDPNSARNAAIACPTGVDGLIMNAGGAAFKSGAAKTPQGSLGTFAMNVSGHCVLMDELISQKKLAKGAKLVYSGSEVSRGVSIMGMAAPQFAEPTVDSIATYIDGSAWTKFDAMVVYAYSKLVAELYMAHMARLHPDYHFVSVSPGATTGTEAFSEASAVQRAMFKFFFGVVLPLSRNCHSLESGAKRYLLALMPELTDGEEARALQKSGAFVAAKSGASGVMADQATVDPRFDDETLQKAAYDAMRRFF